jgi:hypothetical protein
LRSVSLAPVPTALSTPTWRASFSVRRNTEHLSVSSLVCCLCPSAPCVCCVSCPFCPPAPPTCALPRPPRP